MDSERIILGSGKLYCMVFTGEIPEDTAIETDANQLAHIKGGASLEYTAETYTAKDDLGVVQKTVLTSISIHTPTRGVTINGYVGKFIDAERQHIKRNGAGDYRKCKFTGCI